MKNCEKWYFFCLYLKPGIISNIYRHLTLSWFLTCVTFNNISGYEGNHSASIDMESATCKDYFNYKSTYRTAMRKSRWHKWRWKNWSNGALHPAMQLFNSINKRKPFEHQVMEQFREMNHISCIYGNKVKKFTSIQPYKEKGVRGLAN